MANAYQMIQSIVVSCPYMFFLNLNIKKQYDHIDNRTVLYN